SERAALFGVSEGGPMCALFSATYPSRVSALIMQGGFPRRIRTPDFPWGPTLEERQAWIEQMRREWGGTFGLAARAPSMVGDERFSLWWGRLLRMGASPAAVIALVAMNDEIDIRHILPAIRVPTLLLHSVRDATIPIGASRYMAERIPGARLVELPGEDHLPWLSDSDAILGEIEEFDGRPSHRRARPRSRYSALHGHRRRDGKSGRAWRPPLARSSRGTQRSGSPRTRSISWSRDQDSRRWVFRRLRRSRSGCPLRLRGVTGDAVAGTRGPRWPSHWRVRDHGRRYGWDRGPYRRSHRGAGGASGGAGVKHGQGFGRRLWLELSRSRRRPPEGGAGSVAALFCRMTTYAEVGAAWRPNDSVGTD